MSLVPILTIAVVGLLTLCTPELLVGACASIGVAYAPGVYSPYRSFLEGRFSM